ncbi:MULTISPECIES: hypothetical protein [unclassified Lysobacter]|uniref:hypothetical protein n=1 Tax=unclassified Lysobacter TaxID=2635362 RepID=UPI0006FEE985|nr:MULTISPECIES: hypothetical protein [unclassified Lysobacter]KRC38083.1 hypothetical protein ASE10_00355 [Lysobacter sp. Root76]KRD69408.1 hypothetical protein ASE45_09645 [Lysobacter sp. Root96]
MLQEKIRNLMAEATTAQAFRAHTPVGMQEPTVYIPTSAARSALMCLSTDSLTGLFDKDGRLRRTPNAAPSSDEIRLDSVVIANSRVANAGAHIVIYPEATKAHAVGKTGQVALEHVPGHVRSIELAVFSTVDVEEGGTVPTTPLPIQSSAIDWNLGVAKAVRFEISRSDRRKYSNPDELCAQVLATITLGLARAADEVLLSALSGMSLSPFTLGKAAAEGLMVGDLRALTSGAGAAIAHDGVLRASGVPAELTADMAGTIAGAFNRASVVVKDDVTVMFERIGNAGNLSVIAWASMLPIVNDPNKFWIVA